jgi:hypothetical protein
VARMQFLGLQTIGTEAILRTRLQAHLVEIKADDIEIKTEGIENLTDDELRAAARARGMAAPFGRGCTSFMQNQLKDWIELSLDRCASSRRCMHAPRSGLNLLDASLRWAAPHGTVTCAACAEASRHRCCFSAEHSSWRA